MVPLWKKKFTPLQLFAGGVNGAWYDLSTFQAAWRINRLTYTEQFDNAVWTKSNVTVLPDQTTNPTGSNTADLISETATLNQHYIYNNLAGAYAESGASYTLSVYAKKGPGATAPDIVQLLLPFPGFGTTKYANFNILTGTVTYSSNVTTAISNAGGGWWRLSITGTATVSGTVAPSAIMFANNLPLAGRAPSYSGATTSDVYISGAQFERSITATAYQKITNGVQDYLNYFPNSGLFQDSSGATIVTAVEQPVGLVWDKSGRGNHASQSTATKRPVLSARYNLLLDTETLATQNVTTVAADYILAFSGAGTITLSGTTTGVKSAGSNTITCTAGTLTLTVSGSVTQADLRFANDGVGLPAYQRVTTATDYDTVGFPLYLRFDGVDDMLDISAPTLVRNIGFVLVCVAYRSANAVAGFNGLFVANTPTLGSRVGARVGRAGGRRLDADSYFDTTDPAYSADTSRLDSGLFNYTGGTCALRSLGSQVTSFAWASPGNTSDTDSNGISIGAQQGSPSPVYFLTGRIYSLIVRCAVTSTAQIRQTENYLNQESKIY